MNIQQLLSAMQYRLKVYTWRLFCLFKGKSIHSFKLVDGSKFDYPFNSAVGCGLFIGEFETAEVEFILQSVKAGDIFLDIGANGGLFTILASKIIGTTGHVYAFEPGDRELKLLRHNITINNLSNVTVVERAVSNQKSTAKFAISRDGAMNSLFQTDHPQQIIESWKMVETTTVDMFVEELSLKKVDFIKIDVEGAEHLVFEGAKNVLAGNLGNVPTVLFEASDMITSDSNFSVNKFLQNIDSLGLCVYIADRNGNLIKVEEYDRPNEIGVKIYNFIAKSK